MEQAAFEALAREVDQLRSENTIRKRLLTYARGIDRRNQGDIAQVFWPEADCHYGMFRGTAGEFCGEILGWLENSGMDLTSHMIGNIIVDLNGDRAFAESYLTAYHRLKGKFGALTDCIVGARYVDEFERRNGEWRIAKRKLIYDWFREFERSGRFSDGAMVGVNSANGLIGRGGPDPA